MYIFFNQFLFFFLIHEFMLNLYKSQQILKAKTLNTVINYLIQLWNHTNYKIQ